MKKYFLALFFVITSSLVYAQDKIAYVNLQKSLEPIPEYQQILKESEELDKEGQEWLRNLEEADFTPGYKLEKMEAYKEYYQKRQDSLNIAYGNIFNYYSQTMGQIATENGFVIVLDNSDENNPGSFWFSPSILTKSSDYLTEIGIETINSQEIIESNAELNEITQRWEKLNSDFKIIQDSDEASIEFQEIYKSEIAKLTTEKDAAVDKLKSQLINEAKANGQVLLLDKSNPESLGLIWVAPSILENPKNELSQYLNN